MAVIIFFGPDGAGKTTQVRLLLSYLKQKNIKTKRAWIRALHTIAFAISRLLFAAGYYRAVPNARGVETPELDLERVPALKRLWPVIELISVIPLIAYRVKIPSLLGRVVVCERFTIDSVASVTYLTKNTAFPESHVAHILLGMMRDDYILINLDCDYEEILGRRGDLAEPEDFIAIQRQLYDEYRRMFNALRIETSNYSVEETHQIVTQYVEKRLRGAGSS